MSSKTRGHSQRGSALLIVFVFAAFVAIMLYREMPVAVFEAKRQKEQMLIDRGEQYKRGVKLFYKKFGMYPASIQQLEDTNRMRFLRQRYKDPFTGKDDWRLLHMGPGGMLMDSKVNPLKTNNQAGNVSAVATNPSFGTNSNGGTSSSFGSNSSFGTNSSFGNSSSSGSNSSFGNNSSFGTNSGFGSTSNSSASSSFGASSNSRTNSGFGASSNSANSGFGSNTNSSANSGFGDSFSSSSSDQGGVVVPPVPKRLPAIAANGTVPLANPAGASGSDQNGLNQPGEPGQSEQLPENGTQPGQPGQPNPATTTQPGQQQQPDNGQTGLNQTGAAGGQGANSMDSIRRMLSNPSAQLQPSTSSGNSGVRGGGFAGVASKAKGHSIKAINDQVDYSLWEFYYDPSKDVKQVLPGTGPQGATPGLANTPVSVQGRTNGNTPAPTDTPASNPSPSNQNGTVPEPGTPAAYTGPPPPDTPPEQPEEPQP